MYYSISDLEQLSGVHSHTIRMWEQRYKALVPHRSAGNTRYYDDQHLVKLLNIVSLNQKGIKISKICSLSDDDIKNLIDQDIKETISDNQQFEYYITQLISFGIVYDEKSFDAILSECIHANNLSITYTKVIYPLLVRLGLMWQRNSICPAQEHFISNIIRQKINVVTNSLPIAAKKEKAWLLFLPEDETHELGLLFANYLLKKAGKRVIYLGARVPLLALEEVIAFNNIDYILLFMVQTKPTIDAQKYIEELSSLCGNKKIHLSGNSKIIENLKLPDNMINLKTIKDFELLINDKL